MGSWASWPAHVNEQEFEQGLHDTPGQPSAGRTACFLLPLTLTPPTQCAPHTFPADAGPKALLQWLGVVTWFPSLAPPEDPKTAVAALYQQLAAKKLSRFREYAALFPEACFVLVGDSGQVGIGSGGAVG